MTKIQDTRYKGIKSFLLVCCLLFVVSSPALAQEIDFLWQGDNYTPAFYDGRPLWANQTSVTIMAVPSIPGISNPANLNYKWTKNDVVLGTASGTGRNSLSFWDTVLGKPVKIRLEILSNAGAILASKTFTLTPAEPNLLVYENNPLYGILFNNETGASYTMRTDEVTYSAFPLFFTARDRFDPTINYSWSDTAGESESRNSVTYRIPEGASGSSQISVRAEHSNMIIQSARKNFLVQFGQ